MNLFELSHTISPNMPRFSGMPDPVIRSWRSHAESAESGIYEGCSCEVSEVQFVTSLGTYMNSPFHFDPNGATIDQLPLEQLVLPGIVVDCTNLDAGQPILPGVLDGRELAGKAVLFHTGWYKYWGTDHYDSHPFLTGATAETLRNRGAKLVGIDTLVIDDIHDPQRPVHGTLLKAGILIIENMTYLSALPLDEFTLHAAPVRIQGAAAFPVRAYAVANVSH